VARLGNLASVEATANELPAIKLANDIYVWPAARSGGSPERFL
jgi:hypothetical protein